MEGFRGLANFISEVRKAKSKEEVDERVEKELANIRGHFAGSTKLSDYARKKYCWKLVYIFMMGYDVDFGLTEVLALIQAPSFSAKLVGYEAASVLLTSSSELIPSLIRMAKMDILSRDAEVQSVALSAIANIGGKTIAEELAGDVRTVLFSRAGHAVARKKAALVALRLFRVRPEALPIPELAERAGELLDDRSFGVRQASLMLLLGVLPTAASKGQSKLFYPVVPGKAIQMLLQITQKRLCPGDYVYHHVLSPWFQVRLIRILRYFPLPRNDEASYHDLRTALLSILTSLQVTRSVNRNNAEHSVLFEAMNLILRWGTKADPALRDHAAQHLARFVSIKEANIRYLGLVNMAKLASLPGTRETILKQQKYIFISFKEADISLRRAALDLLFVICGKDNAMEIVGELLRYLVLADAGIKEEMVLKIAILAERFAPDLRWYVDTVLELIAHAGDFVTDDIWHRAVQIVTNNDDLQRYAAARMYTALEPDSGVHETAVRVGGYILGEFGDLLCAPPADAGIDMGTDEDDDDDDDDDDDEVEAPATEAGEEGKEKEDAKAAKERAKDEKRKKKERKRLAQMIVSGRDQLAVLRKHFEEVNFETKSLLLTTFAKMANLHPDLRSDILDVLGQYTNHQDTELQQRAVEYTSLPSLGEEAMATVLETMPEFAERDSILESRLKQRQAAAKDHDEWGKEAAGGADTSGGPSTPSAAAREADVGGGAPEGPSDGEESGDEATSGEEEMPGAEDADDAGDDDDLLGLNLGAADQPAPPADVGAAPGFSGGGGFGGRSSGGTSSGGGSAAVSRRVGISSEAGADVRANFAALIVKPRAKLFEDETVQIGAKLETRGALMRITLFFGNKSSTPLERLAVRSPPAHPGLEVTIPEGQATTVDAGKQATVEIRVRCMRPFTDPFPLQISFVSASGSVGHAYPLKLPAVASHFVTAIDMPDDAFNTRWESLADERRSRRVDVPDPSASQRGAGMLTKAIMGGAAPIENGARAAGSFKTETVGPSGQKQSVGVLVRITAVPGRGYRIETCAQHPTIADAIKNSYGAAIRSNVFST